MSCLFSLCVYVSGSLDLDLSLSPFHLLLAHPPRRTQAEEELRRTKKTLAHTKELLHAVEEQRALQQSRQEDYVRLRVEAFRRRKQWRAKLLFFSSWRMYLHQRSLCLVTMRNLLRKKSFSEARIAFSMWKADTKAKRRIAKLRLQAVHIFNVMVHRELREAFSVWRRERGRRKHFRRLLAGALQRRLVGEVGEGKSREGHKVKRQQNSHHLPIRTTQIRGRCFSKWTAFIARSKKLRLACIRFVRTFSRLKLRPALNTWIYILRATKQKDLAIFRLGAKRERAVLFRAFRALRKGCWIESRNKRIVQKCLQKNKSRLVCSSFAAWKMRRLRRRRARLLVKRFIKRYRILNQLAGMVALEVHAKECRQVDRASKKRSMLMQHYHVRWKNVKLHRAYTKWAASVRRRKRIERNVHRALGRMNKRAVVNCFDWWSLWRLVCLDCGD